MKKSAIAKMLTFLGSIYKSKFPFPSGDTTQDELDIEAWYEFLKNENEAEVNTAVKTFSANSDWPPTVKNVLETVRKNRQGIMSPAEAWIEFQMACEKYGVYEEKKTLEALSPLTRKTIESMGGLIRVATYEDEHGFLRKEFKEKYMQLAESEAQRERLPHHVRADVAALTAKFTGKAAIGDGRRIG